MKNNQFLRYRRPHSAPAVLLFMFVLVTGLLAEDVQSPAFGLTNRDALLSRLSVHLIPEVSFAIGPESQLYKMGGTLHLSGRYQLLKPVTLYGGIDYSLLPLAEVSNAYVSIFTVVGGAAYGLSITDWLTAQAELGVGYYLGFLSPVFAMQGAAEISAAAVALFHLSSRFTLGVRGGYQWRIGLNQTISAGIHVYLNLGTTSGHKVDM